ncbi:lysylphosphatidylglycerol synthase transmembrane domain-containing protein [Salinarimonas sp. NSM]|uniref:lysylphosphatidylglycerol synthase transmembrane domain-containing protein n=1 Tax=Salinarimonas sp. NSM TaxID=3458003 RepID=UPI0040356009
MVQAVLKLGVMVALFAALYHFELIRVEDLAAFAAMPGAVVAVVTLSLGQILLAGVRLWLLLVSQGVRIGLRAVTRINLIATFGTVVLPGTWGGDAVRAALLLRQASRQRASAMVGLLIDKLVSLAAMVALLAGATLAMADRLPEAVAAIGRVAGAGVVVGVAAVALAAAFSAPLRRRLDTRDGGGPPHSRMRAFARDVALALLAASARPVALVVSFVSAGLIHLVGIVSVLIVADALGAPGIDLTSSTFLTTASFLASLVPLTPGGLGVAEAAFAQAALLLDGTSSAFAYGGVFLAFRILFSLATLPGLALVLVSDRPFRDALGLGPTAGGEGSDAR